MGIWKIILNLQINNFFFLKILGLYLPNNRKSGHFDTTLYYYLLIYISIYQYLTLKKLHFERACDWLAIFKNITKKQHFS